MSTDAAALLETHCIGFLVDTASKQFTPGRLQFECAEVLHSRAHLPFFSGVWPFSETILRYMSRAAGRENHQLALRL